MDTESRRINLRKVAEQLFDVIVEDYNAKEETTVKAYLGAWKGRIKFSTKVNSELLSREDP